MAYLLLNRLQTQKHKAIRIKAILQIMVLLFQVNILFFSCN